MEIADCMECGAVITPHTSCKCSYTSYEEE